jgi:hypothetical protein
LTFEDSMKSAGKRTVTSARPDASGVATVSLPAGTYWVSAQYEARQLATSTVTVGAAAVAATIELSPLGQLDFSAVRSDKSGAVLGPTPTKLVLVAGHDSSPFMPTVLERYMLATDAATVPAGDYTAFVSHGPEYELDRQNITVPAGGHVSLSAKVQHVVDTSGWISADLHLHSAKSVDSDAPRPLRAIGAVAEGVEILISTEHDMVADYSPIVHALGLDTMVRTVSGTEVSPVYGHINAFPLQAESPEAYWRVVWYKYKDTVFDRVMDPAEIVRELRALNVEYVQINHPRSGQGGFDYIGFDPATGMSQKEFPAADGFEILNSKGGGAFDRTFADYVGLIKMNHRLTGSGVSDAHGAYTGIGYARTMIRSSSDDPNTLDMPAVYKALRDGKVVALSGPMVTLEAQQGANKAEIGETLPASGPIQLAVHVEAPSWMELDDLRIYENGDLLVDHPLTDADRSTTDPVVRLDRTFTATAARDSFYMVVVEGNTPCDPVFSARPRSVTNAVFVDADGGGFHFSR